MNELFKQQKGMSWTYQVWRSDFNHITVESGFISLTVFSSITVILVNRWMNVLISDITPNWLPVTKTEAEPDKHELKIYDNQREHTAQRYFSQFSYSMKQTMYMY